MPIINKGGLKKHDKSVISLLHALNKKAREQNLSKTQQLDMLQTMIPNGLLKAEIRLSIAHDIQAVYYMLCAMNPAVDSLKELDLKLLSWRLILG